MKIVAHCTSAVFGNLAGRKSCWTSPARRSCSVRLSAKTFVIASCSASLFFCIVLTCLGCVAVCIAIDELALRYARLTLTLVHNWSIETVSIESPSEKPVFDGNRGELFTASFFRSESRITLMRFISSNSIIWDNCFCEAIESFVSTITVPIKSSLLSTSEKLFIGSN